MLKRHEKERANCRGDARRVQPEAADALVAALGFEGMLKPMKFTCSDHQGADQARIQQWDGKAWKTISDFYTADESILAPMVKAQAEQYAAEKKITPRDCAKES